MPKAKFEKIQEGAYFLVDPSNFQVSVSTYDPLVANQTILFGWDESRLEASEPPPVEVAEIHRETEVPTIKRETEIP
jgi:hypothetical protein